jgi:hypothetical protein
MGIFKHMFCVICCRGKQLAGLRMTNVGMCVCVGGGGGGSPRQASLSVKQIHQSRCNGGFSQAVMIGVLAHLGFADLESGKLLLSHKGLGWSPWHGAGPIHPLQCSLQVPQPPIRYASSQFRFGKSRIGLYRCKTMLQLQGLGPKIKRSWLGTRICMNHINSTTYQGFTLLRDRTCGFSSQGTVCFASVLESPGSS